MKRMTSEISQINQEIPVDTDELVEKAGTRLKKRYPAITKYSENLPTNGKSVYTPEGLHAMFQAT